MVTWTFVTGGKCNFVTGKNVTSQYKDAPYDPSTSTLTSAIFNGSATTVATLDSNTNLTYYPTFVLAGGSGQQLRIDSVVSPFTYNPNTALMTVNNLALLSSASTVSLGGSGNTTLTLDGASYTFRNFNCVPTGTTNTVATLNVTNNRVNGFYTVGILNNGSGVLTINTGLGAIILQNIRVVLLFLLVD